jgi:hypothetical protein
MTDPILREIADFGYTVSTVSGHPAFITMVAVDWETEEVFIAMTDRGEFETARELARMVGLDLDDG